MAIIKEQELTEFAFQLLGGGAYNIGLHGISEEALARTGDISMEKALEDIMLNGLLIHSGRSINGTVYSCGRIDSKEDIVNVNDNLRGYRYGDSNCNVIVAIPVVIENAVGGDSIYIGKTNLDNEFGLKMSTTGYEVSSLADIAVVFDEKDKKRIPSEFVLGYYEILNDGTVDFFINPRHVSYNDGKVTDYIYRKVNRNVDIALLDSIELKEILSKKELSEKDREILNRFFDRYKNVTGSTLTRLIPILETIKQRLNEHKIEKVTREDIASLNVNTAKRIDYKSLYEGLEGEDLFFRELHILDNMRVEAFRDDDGKLLIHSEVPGESEEFLRLLNDRGFIDRLFKYGSSLQIKRVALLMTEATKDDLLLEEDIYLKMFKYSYYALEDYNIKGLLTRDMLVKAAETSNFNIDTLYKLPEEYSDDYELICKFIDGSNKDNFGFYVDYGESNLAYSSISREIRCNPDFWDKLNNKIREINEDGGSIPYFDKEKELELARGRRF